MLWQYICILSCECNSCLSIKYFFVNTRKNRIYFQDAYLIFICLTIKIKYKLINIMTNTIDNFKIIGNKIYDPGGKEFILKGINIFAWEGINNIDSHVDSSLNKWGFNAIRVPNYLLGSWGQPHPECNNYSTNKIIVDAYTSQGAVVIFSAHDLIGGYYEGNDWEVLKDFWRDMAQEFKDNPNVWFNLHNEPGNATPNPQWVAYHRELIDIIRNEGANNLIIVDGEAWGQDKHTRTLENCALEVMENNENILFSITFRALFLRVRVCLSCPQDSPSTMMRLLAPSLRIISINSR